MRACLLLCCLAAASSGADLELSAVLRAVEQRYNRAATLEAEFEQRHLVEGRPRRIESGRLSCCKPGRMRWEYARPAGKLFVCDGRWVWLYTPGAPQVERARLKEADDFRAPLAFLLGRLDFRRALRRSSSRGRPKHGSCGPGRSRTAPCSPAWISPWMRSSRSGVWQSTRRTATAMEFLFSNERLNVAVPEAAFRFVPPAGIPVVDSGQ